MPAIVGTATDTATDTAPGRPPEGVRLTGGAVLNLLVSLTDRSLARTRRES
ncbi:MULTISPECIES: hypothetical protein [unclassified Streptomyces]|uniref:hypothetical protein n=1 Tax=unclassified Streptomyces TaxID=2593676 RepID=UPI0013DE3C55|nr:hypothetical protein [Streptomyces sp. CNQ-509]